MANGQTPQQLTQNELAFLKAKVDRTIFLLDVSAMPNEVKTAWVTLLPHMTLEQVDRLTALLEEEIELTLKESKKYPEDEEFILKLKAAKERYDSTVAQADKKALAQLARIEEDINALAAQ
ncbi:hypothetical protein A3B21_05280 [Candidatus Uhrbacteria bacterium RIFCSPLOWO2_01_FULL_47_24]|uniref:Uncharacterized protein n=1 Tax=Candidatus Uhrbacteria bacterium RIFCSPLOWO2_01_FULL_47_24 TaxID=1802401 RepID=A0A1F7UWI1_9BACT|nr:MAG: hypothetical protein A2753_03315 [Candidatus Uhrbacteria bacterium RIFCSPHIGHO2_01_FULL_47_11]OGL68419.1 MAG: hypothetical protein A3D58_03940 [Candidatus Uhrbacteria bacterium RIFCSPHIGHO2_02_FULL_46_47]OGL76761.1 MAG: hypothetical protein A3F52_00875 [Candidatus Uhrbacteria bacterium RIFCSPHIGHO2_12_FULL_47_11]OGL82094.1 MAG: hypothetical protein A3B21_05280 [Candidatus Uhrbacteria bacterium RIFCSPLOWO2_01_FULL_47_24]OGL85489.1 MAG: hypothetical protein A3J03_05445 [Candidatus Uhrbact